MKPDIAVIDIGSNSVRLMLGAAVNGRVRRISKTLNTTRLANGVDATGELAPDRMADTVDAIRTFYGEAKGYGVRSSPTRQAPCATPKTGTRLF